MATRDQETIEFSRGVEATGLLTLPDEAPRGVVSVLPPVFGVNDYVARIGRQLADEGYASVAVDYWKGNGAPPLGSPDEVMRAVGSVSDPQTIDDVVASVDELRGRTDAPLPAAVLGFCMGGSIAIGAAASTALDLACVVAFYGLLRYGALDEAKPRSPIDYVDDVHCPLLAHFGTHDHLISQDDVAELDRRMGGKVAEVYTYPGAGHAFHEDFRPPVFRPVAAADAWRRTLIYLDAYTGRSAGS